MKRESPEEKDAEFLADSRILRIVEEALAEDIGLGDVTTESTVPDEVSGTRRYHGKGERNPGRPRRGGNCLQGSRSRYRRGYAVQGRLGG